MYTDPNRISIKFLIFLLCVAAWRKLSKRAAVQAPLHRHLKKFAVVLQWYTVLFVGFVVFSAVSLVVFMKDILFVSAEAREDNLREMFELSTLGNVTFEEFEAGLSVGTFVTTANVFGQIAGVLVVAISMYHAMVLLVIPSHRKAIDHEDYQSYSWHVPKRVNWLLWIVALPAAFSIEVLLANISVWAIMDGLAPSRRSSISADCSYECARRLEFMYVKEDLQIATMFQFTAVYAFTRLTSSLLTDTSLMKGHSDVELLNLAKEYKSLIRNGGFIGIWLYIIAGMVRAAVVIVLCTIIQTAILRNNDDDGFVQWLEDMEEAFNGAVGLTFAALTMLSILNMLIMTRTTIISEKLGDRAKGEHDANKKFIGVRLLLICSEVVPKAIDFFEIGTPQFEQVKKLTAPLSFLHVTAEQAEILKNTILSFGCLLAAIMNFIFWRSLNIEQAGLLDFTDMSRTYQNSSKEGNDHNGPSTSSVGDETQAFIS
mmetsp:Transcript_83100/g.216983  ORF Transcript_83100/g.216983 Transcript_83100/m.216983 type:complete len:485 (-) Transcript_83100:118-1572(-)